MIRIRTLLLAAVALVLGPQVAWGQAATAAPPYAQVEADIHYLAADELEGRGVGTAGLDSAAAFIARRFARIGLSGPGRDGFFQRFRIDPTAPAAAHAGLGDTPVKNVIGILPGRGPLAGQVVVIGAHYDHLGLGGMGSLDPDSMGVVHNGADDNGSGTAAILEIARLLAERPGNRRTIVLIAFTAEEMGLIGSTHYVRNPVRPNDSTVVMLNLDMVGRLSNNRLQALGAETAREFNHLLDSLNAIHNFALEASGDGWGRSDHASFYAEGIPVLHFFTDLHEDYHRTTDSPDRINHEGVARIATFVADLAQAIATRPARLTFVDMPRPQPVMAGSGASLGTIPDMSGSPGGVRLTGVRAGTPAADAGIQAGDIIVRIGTHTVENLYDMTNALAAHRPGDVVVVVVRRGDKTMEFTVTLGRRGG